MCGILGTINLNSQFDINNLLNGIKHRGPDSDGFLKHQNLVLGHKRLAIQDLSPNGQQPMESECSNYVIVFNGEIYNHLDIREKYLPHQKFKSHSDTETLLYGFAKYGVEILNHLNGIFAFAFLDKISNELVIVRDQFGVKPLYYYYNNDFLWFSSEIKTILDTDFNPEIRTKSFVDYLTFLYAPGETTPFEHIKKLLPGHYLKININSVGKLVPERYYDIPFDNQRFESNEQKLICELEGILIKAVDRQMLADVSVGFFLSGGLDSSCVVALAKKIHPEKRFKCYTIKTNDGEDMSEGFKNDLFFARVVAKYLDVDLIEVDNNVDIVNDFDKMIYHLDEPQADPAPLSVYNICKKARRDGIVVLLGGTAGDDIFSGYRRHQALNYEKYIIKISFFLRKIIYTCIQILPTKTSTFRRARKLTERIHLNQIDRLVGFFSWLNLKKIKNLFHESQQEQIRFYNPLNYLKDCLKDIPRETSLLNQMLYLEMRSFLVDHNLNYTDKMSMATGVKVRVPFLDKELVEFSTKIPVELKLKRMTTKYLLKKVMEKYLPNQVIYRPKSGFGAPVRSWIINEMNELIETRLSKKRIEELEIFNYREVQKLIKDNRNGKIDASYTIWSLLAIDSWMMQFVKK